MIPGSNHGGGPTRQNMLHSSKCCSSPSQGCNEEWSDYSLLPPQCCSPKISLLWGLTCLRNVNHCAVLPGRMYDLPQLSGSISSQYIGG